MRTTITLGDDLGDATDALARRLGVSRSRLIQDALERHLKLFRELALTEQANACVEASGSTLDADFERYVARAWAQDMGDDAW